MYDFINPKHDALSWINEMHDDESVPVSVMNLDEDEHTVDSAIQSIQSYVQLSKKWPLRC